MQSLLLGLFKYCVMRLVRFTAASFLALLLTEEGHAEPCNDPRTLPASLPQAKCETVVRKKPPKTANLTAYAPASSQGAGAEAPVNKFEPLRPSPLRPDWVYLGTGIVDAHVGERRIYMDGRPTHRYTGVTLIAPYEQSQYNPYPVGPEIGAGWKTPAIAAYGITDFGVGLTSFRNSMYRDATILGFRFGHDLAPGVNAGIVIGPVFSGYSEPIAVAAEVELDVKQIAVSQNWSIANIIPKGFIVKDRIMPAKAECWTPGQGANVALELWAGFKFSLQ